MAGKPDGSLRGCLVLGLPGWVELTRIRRVLRWLGDTFRTALQLRLGVPLSVLIAAGVPQEGILCWLRRFAVAAPQAGLPADLEDEEAPPVDTEAAAAADAASAVTDTAAAAPRERVAREGPSTPSPHVHGIGMQARSVARAGGPSSPILSARQRLQRRTTAVAPALSARFRPHDPVKCGPADRRLIDRKGRGLFDCNNQGFNIATHDAIALALAAVAPPLPMGEWPGADHHATAVKPIVAMRMTALAPGRKWWVPDVALSNPRHTFVDIKSSHTASACHLPGAQDGRTSVVTALSAAEQAKVRHYEREGAPGGPFAPGTGFFVPFVMTLGGLLAPSAIALLKRMAAVRRDVVADGADPCEAEASLSYLRHSVQVLSTVLQRWNACRIHAAAVELCELRSTSLGTPWPAGVEAPHELHRLNPGPAVRGLLSFDPRLADIDVVGLRPVASLFE